MIKTLATFTYTPELFYKMSFEINPNKIIRLIFFHHNWNFVSRIP